MSIRRRGREDGEEDDELELDPEEGGVGGRGYSSDGDLPSSRGRRWLARGRRALLRARSPVDADDDSGEWCKGWLLRLLGFCLAVLIMEMCVLSYISFRMDQPVTGGEQVQVQEPGMAPPPPPPPPPVEVATVQQQQQQQPPVPVVQPPIVQPQPQQPVQQQPMPPLSPPPPPPSQQQQQAEGDQPFRMPEEPGEDVPQTAAAAAPPPPPPPLPPSGLQSRPAAPHFDLPDEAAQPPPVFSRPGAPLGTDFEADQQQQNTRHPPTTPSSSGSLVYRPRLSNKNEFLAERHRMNALDETGAFTESRLETAVGKLREERGETGLRVYPGAETDLRRTLAASDTPISRDAALYTHLIRCYSLHKDTVPVWFDFQVARMTHMVHGWRRSCLLFWATKRHTEGSLRVLRDKALQHAVDGGVLPSVLLYNGGFLHYSMKGEDGLAGDPLQWTDLLAALLALGVPVTVVKDKAADPELTLTRLQSFDLIFTDYLGVDSLPVLKDPSLACRLRVLDAYGTTEPFNSGPGVGLAPFCCLKLDLGQFLTFLPGRAPGNTFLGFAVDHLPPHSFIKNPPFTRQHAEKPVLRSTRDKRREPLKFKLAKVHVETVEGVKEPRAQRQWYGLVWGKLGKYYNKPGVEQFLHRLAEHIPLLATVGPDKQYVPPFVSNFGILKQSSYANLVRSVVLLVGIGEPFLGNGAVEALAGGTVVINLKFHEPVKPHGKPTSQVLTSQHPELETVPEPYAWTLSLNATRGEVSKVMAQILTLFHDTQPFGHRYDPPGHSMPDFMTSVLNTVSTDFCGRGF